LNDLRLEVQDPLAPITGRFAVQVAAKNRTFAAKLTPHSFGQICGLLRVPPQFIERVPAPVALRLLRTLQDTSELMDGRALLLRFRGKEPPLLRAILPHSFVRFDDADIVRAIRSHEGEALEAQDVRVDEDSLFLRLLLADPKRQVNLGSGLSPDPGFVGMSIYSSETGAHPLVLRHSLLRLVCENGLTIPVEEGRPMRRRFTQVDRRALERAIDGALSQMIPRGEELAKKLAATRAETVRDADAEIFAIFRRHRLGSPRGRLGRWVTEEVHRNLSLFGAQRFEIVQAFTAVARGLESPDRLRFEDAMGAYLSQPETRN
jgi:hypothetical protein